MSRVGGVRPATFERPVTPLPPVAALRGSVSAEDPSRRPSLSLPVSSGGRHSAAAGGDLSRFSVQPLGSPSMFLTRPAPFISLCVPAFSLSLLSLFPLPSLAPMSDFLDPLPCDPPACYASPCAEPSGVPPGPSPSPAHAHGLRPTSAPRPPRRPPPPPAQ